jgi:C4-type Zn-finger protein
MMATQRCPRCKSNRIRHGYRPTPFFRRLILRYNLLCNDCNWEFVGFAIPGTISSKVKRKKKTDQLVEAPKIETVSTLMTDLPNISEVLENSQLENTENLVETQLTGLENLNNDTIAEAQAVENSQPKKNRNAKVRKRVKVKFT